MRSSVCLFPVPSSPMVVQSSDNTHTTRNNIIDHSMYGTTYSSNGVSSIATDSTLSSASTSSGTRKRKTREEIEGVASCGKKTGG